MSFAPDPRIEAASTFVADLSLCQVRLQDDARWPWLVLLPRREGLREVEELAADERARLMEEIVVAGRALRELGPFDKLNVAALGNVVPQLHVHVVGRRVGDEAWPDPIWGRGAAVRYDRGDLLQRIDQLARALGR